LEAYPFLKRQWYVAARSDEVADRPLGRRICDEPMVFFRDADSRAAALGDRCPHRKYPLSAGEIIGGEIRCGYHGLHFDGTGACTLIPSQAAIPRGLRARSYAVQERHGLLFVWMGDPATADPALVPDFHENDAPGWVAVHGYHYVAAHYQLLVDNLLDLTHLPVVHKTTLAGPGIMENPLEVEVAGDSIHTRRNMLNVDPAPIHRTVRRFAGKIDRRTVTRYLPPSYVHINAFADAAGTNENPTVPHHVIINSLTPETERSTHYFWSIARCEATGDASVSRTLYDMSRIAFDEDAAILAAQQRMIEEDRTGAPLASLDGDKAASAARRIIAMKLAAEMRQPG
jgi:phenylpropionate dioxygenase-like ring-hydroxylating dioxygenase large terminal subunit